MAETRDFAGFDGTRLACTEMGEGPAMLLLHGLFSSARTNWVRYGTAKRLADAGYRLILPDFRGHGGSDTPADPEAWPADVLAQDIEALIAQLNLGTDFVLGGYSLGARTSLRLLARGLRPRALMLGGMGLAGITGGSERGQWFIRMIEGRGTWARGTAEFTAEAFMKASIENPDAIVHLLQGQQSTAEATLAGLALPTLVVCGADDRDNGSAPDLAARIPGARYVEIPGNHMSAVTRPELGEAMLAFLQDL
ncbi:alpha/beta hydrolase [Sandaracinobacter sp. RS1-74]|uniref:alpha/beta fold hydrolase n=1 Tax=Sandaracinobacteroides sayramensis TaxID=2913411 RepID=UPI001EDADA45|nr:alpha/beta hydrolase [Sandaracinobacteroides sayramensis]MCG2841937.1 alpha/beta hydrolase [Sandaracinobacteroides sayramensis]